VQWLAGVPHHPWFNLGDPIESIRHSQVFDAAFDDSHFHDWALAASKVERRRLLHTRESGSDVQPTWLLTEEYKNRVQTGG